MTQNPFHAVFAAMTEDEKAEHLAEHPAFFEAYTDAFAKRAGVPVQITIENTWSGITVYRARIGCFSNRFGIDRRHTFKAQMDHGAYYLGTLQAEYEIHKIINLHGVTDARKV